MNDPRGRLLKWFLGLSVLGSVISSLSFVYATQKWQEAVATIALAFTSTALSAALIEISVRIREVWERVNLIRQFAALFGTADQTSQTAAIVLACFPTKEWPIAKEPLITTDQPYGVTEAWSKYSLKHLASIHSLGTTMADIEVASDVIAAFSGVGLPTPKIVWDIHAIAEAQRADSTVSTFISVGLSSNVFSVWVATEKSQAAIKIDSADTIKVASRFEGADSWTEFRETADKGPRYGLLAKCALENDKTAMVVGGISAEASTLMSSFLSKHWQDILRARDPQSNRQVGNSEFSVVVEITKGGVEICDLRVRRSNRGDARR
jgi:hypothetical protein